MKIKIMQPNTCLGACLKPRSVRGPGLQACELAADSCRPRALTRRLGGIFKHASKFAVPFALLCAHCCGNRVGASPAVPHPDAAGGPARRSAFSPYPTDSEIFQARLFDEPIIPVGRK